MNISKRKKTVIGSLASLILLGGIGTTGVVAANAASNPAPPSSSHSEKGEKGETQEVTIKGSIAVTESATEQSDAVEAANLAKLATIDQKSADAAALPTVPGGSVVSTSLDDEDGFVVYEVTVKDKTGAITEVIVDAGNAKVLASEVEDNEAAEGPESSNESESGSTVEAPDVQDVSPGTTTGK